MTSVVLREFADTRLREIATILNSKLSEDEICYLLDDRHAKLIQRSLLKLERHKLQMELEKIDRINRWSGLTFLIAPSAPPLSPS